MAEKEEEKEQIPKKEKPFEKTKPPRTGAQRMADHLKLQSKNYESEWSHFNRYMNEQDELPKPANGWLVASDKNSFPDFTVELLEKYSSWLLDNFKKGRKVSAESEAGEEGAVKDTKEVQK